MVKLVLISGKAESGKDTVANLIKSKVGDEFKVITTHIADKVKSIAKLDFGWDGVKDGQGRALLQLIGDGGRNYNPDIWINHFLSSLNGLKEGNVLVLIPDVRYRNEVVKLKNWGISNNVQTFTLRVDRPNYKNNLTKEQRSNSSETDLDNWNHWDFKISNDSTIENLDKNVDKVLEVIKVGHKS